MAEGILLRVAILYFFNASIEYTFDKYFQLGVAMVEEYSGIEMIDSIRSSR